MAVTTHSMLYFGRLAVIDTDESAIGYEGAFDLRGTTTQSPDLQVMVVTIDDIYSDDKITADDNAASVRDEVTYDLDGTTYTSEVDASFRVSLTVTFSDGSAVSFNDFAIQMPNGDTFLTLIYSDNAALLDGKNISEITFTSVNSTEYSLNISSFNDVNSSVVCFNQGSLIETAEGPVRVEDLKPGVLVKTYKNGLQPLRAVLKRKISQDELQNNEKLRPVRIGEGCLGNELPTQDLIVSRQHRMLVQSPICKRMFGQVDVLVSGIRLTKLPGIDVDYEIDVVVYYHLVFDNHEVVTANGALSESFYPGPMALKALAPEAYDEIVLIFPDLKNDKFALKSGALIPTHKQQAALISRHLKNKKAIQVGRV